MNSSSETRCDHNQFDEFHDCYIVGVFSDTMIEHKAEITIQCYSCGARLVMTLEGIHRMSVHDFWEGNIIYDIKQYMWPDMPMELLDDVFHGPPGELKTKYPFHLDEIRDKDMILVHATPSYGCEIVALCKSVTVRGPADKIDGASAIPCSEDTDAEQA